MGNAICVNLVGYGKTPEDAKNSLINKICAKCAINSWWLHDHIVGEYVNGWLNESIVTATQNLEIIYLTQNDHYKCILEGDLVESACEHIDIEYYHYGSSAFKSIRSEYIYKYGQTAWNKNYKYKIYRNDFCCMTETNIAHFIKINEKTHQIKETNNEMFIDFNN